METQFNKKEKNKIQKAIREKYTKVAKSPDGLFKYPTGRAGLETLQYDSSIIQQVERSLSDLSYFSACPGVTNLTDKSKIQAFFLV
jgi:hypothetical protein